MGQFKPMVKMETTEPSVELKLKKGGHVSMKKGKKSDSGHHMMDGGIMNALSSPRRSMGMPPTMMGAAPARPAMALRRKAMAAMPTPMMKKGGEMESKHDQMMEDKRMSRLEAELKKHEKMPAHLAHKGMASGGSSDERMKNLAKAREALQKCKEGGGMHHLDKCEMHLAKCGGGSMKKMATGGATGKNLDAFETKTTVKGNVKPFEKTEMHTAKKDSAHGTGGVKEGNGGGYKKGGSINSETSYGDYATTKVDQAKPDSAHGTGGVSMSNAGGFKKGGKAKYKTGGGVEKYAVDNVEGTPKGVTNTTTGEVKESNGGGYKKGGALKKHFATGGSVNRTGHAVVMPQASKPASKATEINMLSGVFKKGGHVKKFDGGGSTGDKIIDQENQRRLNELNTTKYENQHPFKTMFNNVKEFVMGPPTTPAGSVTKTKESVTVAPQKKRGGSIKR